MPAPNDHFVEYLEAHLEERGWSIYDFAKHAQLSASVVFRWRKGYRPYIDNARRMASALNVPLLEVLVEAGQLTQQEARLDDTTSTPHVQDASVDELYATIERTLAELQRRRHAADDDAAQAVTSQLRLVRKHDHETELQTAAP